MESKKKSKRNDILRCERGALRPRILGFAAKNKAQRWLFK